MRWNCHGCDLRTDDESVINAHLSDEYRKMKAAKRSGEKYTGDHWVSSPGLLPGMVTRVNE